MVPGSLHLGTGMEIRRPSWAQVSPKCAVPILGVLESNVYSSRDYVYLQHVYSASCYLHPLCCDLSFASFSPASWRHSSTSDGRG
jgi:hypothetical protein